MSSIYSEFNNDFLFCHRCYGKLDIAKFLEHYYNCKEEPKSDSFEPKNLKEIINRLVSQDNIQELIEEYNKEIENKINQDTNFHKEQEKVMSVIPVKKLSHSTACFKENEDTNSKNNNSNYKASKSRDFLKRITEAELFPYSNK